MAKRLVKIGDAWFDPERVLAIEPMSYRRDEEAPSCWIRFVGSRDGINLKMAADDVAAQIQAATWTK